jgi:hypothetical protein
MGRFDGLSGKHDDFNGLGELLRNLAAHVVVHYAFPGCLPWLPSLAAFPGYRSDPVRCSGRPVILDVRQVHPVVPAGDLTWPPIKAGSP